MTTTSALSKCPTCQAVVNRSWSACPACSEPLIQPGSCLEWPRADVTIQHGVVDFIHVDAGGTPWAFVNFGENWAAVNLRYAKMVTA